MADNHKTFTIGDLRRVLAAIPADFDCFEVIVRTQDDESTLVGGLIDATLDAGCSDARALVLDGMDDAERADVPMCQDCNERPATCLGNYEDHNEETCARAECTQHRRYLACDECCGHGNEDGHCEPIRANALESSTVS